MVNIQEVRAQPLIEKVADELKENDAIEKPEWAKHAKTGAHNERRPDNPDWWFKRASSILRKLYIHGPQGVGTLRDAYGGRKTARRGPAKHEKASGKVIRTSLQQLEEAGYVEQVDEGRKITSEGKSVLDAKAAELKESE